jgi:hypothetical protein
MYKKNIVGILLFFCATFVMNYFSFPVFAQKDFKIVKEGDVIIVSNPKKPIPKNGLKKRIVFKEDLSIGVIEGEENYMFGSRVEFNVDKQGNFYISDYDNKRIQKYDAQGNYLLTIGRAGQGPGEFEFLAAVQFDEDDNIYVCDIRNRRVSFFNKKGKFLKQINIPDYFYYMYKDSEGHIIGYRYNWSDEAGIRKYVRKFGLFDEKYNMIKMFQIYKRTFALPENWDKASTAQFYANAYSSSVFKPYIVYTWDKGYIFTGFTDNYEINVFSHEGKLLKKINRAYKPLRVRRKDRSSFIKEIQEDPDIHRIPESERKNVFAKIKFPKYKPAYQDLIILENGWLAVAVDSFENEYALVDLFNKQGRYSTQFESTIFTYDLFFKNGKAFAVAKQEGFPFVKRYAIELQEYKDKKWVKSKIRLY